MPRVPIDYSKTIIYKIVCLDEKVDEIYVGHTTDFKSRKKAHKDDCYNKNVKRYNYKLYQFIRANGDWCNFVMLPIEEYPCQNSIQACIREEYWRLELQAQLNARKSYISKEDRKIQKLENMKHRYEKNKEQITEYNKQYRQENREQITEKRKEKYTCDCGSILRISDKVRHERSKKHQDFLDSKI